jgi:hypothetical protein
MGNLSALLPNATPLEADFSVKCQRNVSFKATVLKKSFRFRQSLRTILMIVSNNYPRISDKISFAIEDKALIINNYRYLLYK